MLQHNVSTPRPYDRINLIQGTKGIFRDYPSRIYIEDDADSKHNGRQLKDINQSMRIGCGAKKATWPASWAVTVEWIT
jgi:hypothetical protein